MRGGNFKKGNASGTSGPRQACRVFSQLVMDGEGVQPIVGSAITGLVVLDKKTG